MFVLCLSGCKINDLPANTVGIDKKLYLHR